MCPLFTCFTVQVWGYDVYKGLGSTYMVGNMVDSSHVTRHLFFLCPSLQIPNFKVEVIGGCYLQKQGKLLNTEKSEMLEI